MKCPMCNSEMKCTHSKEFHRGLECERDESCTNDDCDFKTEYSYGAYRERYEGKWYMGGFEYRDLTEVEK